MRKRRRTPGALMTACGLAAFAALIIVSSTANALLGVLTVGGLLLLGRALRENIYSDYLTTQPSAEELQRLDSRPPVLYLRSFASDLDKQDPRREIATLSAGTQGRLLKNFIYVPSYEETLAFHFDQIGPLIALSNPVGPGELGASRFSKTGDAWKDLVRHLVERSQLILIRTGDTPGLEWELEQIVGQKKMPLVIFYIQFAGSYSKGVVAARYKKFARQVESLWGAALPPFDYRRKFITTDDGKNFVAHRSLAHALIAKGHNVESSSSRTIAKAVWPLAWNAPDNIPTITARIPLALRVVLYLVVAGLLGATLGYLNYKTHEGLLSPDGGLAWMYFAWIFGVLPALAAATGLLAAKVGVFLRVANSGAQIAAAGILFYAALSVSLMYFEGPDAVRLPLLPFDMLARAFSGSGISTFDIVFALALNAVALGVLPLMIWVFGLSKAELAGAGTGAR